MKKFFVALLILLAAFVFADGTCQSSEGETITVSTIYNGNVLMRTDNNTVVLSPTVRTAFVDLLKSNIAALTTMQTEKIAVNRVAETSHLDTEYKNGLGLWIYLNTSAVGPYTLRIQVADMYRESLYLTVEQANNLVSILEDSLTKSDGYIAQNKRVDELLSGIK